MKPFLSVLKRVLLWSYHRGSWQYDILCILILAFIFFTPSDWFNPEPEEPKSKVEQPAPVGATPNEERENLEKREQIEQKKSQSPRPEP